MTTSYPGALDSLTNPTATDDTSILSHAAQHANANDAIEALEATVGITGAFTFAKAVGTAGGAGVAGADVSIAGGTGDAGADAGASLTVGGGDGAGNPGHVEVTGDLWVGTITGAGHVSIVSSGVALLASDPAYIQASGSDVSMGGVLTQEVGGIFVKHMGGTADPSAGAGVAANVASLYARDNSGTGELWVKTGASNTAWTQVI